MLFIKRDGNKRKTGFRKLWDGFFNKIATIKSIKPYNKTNRTIGGKPYFVYSCPSEKTH